MVIYLLTLSNMSSKGQATSDPADALASDLRISVVRLARRLRTERADHGLTLGQISMLATIDKHGPMTASELATHEGIRPPSVTRTVDSLAALDLVTRTCAAEDRRQTVIALTPAAVALLTEDRRRRDALLADLLESLSPSDRALLARAAPLLDRLASS